MLDSLVDCSSRVIILVLYKDRNEDQEKVKTDLFAILGTIMVVTMMSSIPLTMIGYEEKVADSYIGSQPISGVRALEKQRPVIGETYYVCNSVADSVLTVVEDSNNNRMFLAHNPELETGNVVTYTENGYQIIGYWEPTVDSTVDTEEVEWGHELSVNTLYKVAKVMWLHVHNYRWEDYYLTLILDGEDGRRYQTSIAQGGDYTIKDFPKTESSIQIYDSLVTKGDTVRYCGDKIFEVVESGLAGTVEVLSTKPNQNTPVQDLAELNWDKLPEEVQRQYTSS